MGSFYGANINITLAFLFSILTLNGLSTLLLAGHLLQSDTQKDSDRHVWFGVGEKERQTRDKTRLQRTKRH